MPAGGLEAGRPCVVEYVCHSVHVSDLQRGDWAEQRNAVFESALDRYLHKRALPTS